MDSRRSSHRQLSPALMRIWFIIQISFLFLITLGAVSYKIYKSTRKIPSTAPVQQVEPNALADANQIPNGEDQ